MVRLYKYLLAIAILSVYITCTSFISKPLIYLSEPLALKILWKFNLSEHNSTQPIPVFNNGTIYIYNNQGHLFALDPKKGLKKWDFKASGKIYSPPTVLNDIIYLSSYDGTLYSLYASNARIKWSAKTYPELVATPYIIDGNEVSIIKKNKMQGFDLETGLDLWKKECPFINYKEIFDYPNFLIFTDNNRFIAEKPKKCEIVWDYSPGNMRVDYFQVTDNNVVLSTAKILFVLNLNDGKELWKHNTNPKEILMKGPIFTIYKDEIFVVFENQVMIYDLKSGGLKKTFKNKEEIKRIVVTEGKMLLFNEIDEVYLIDRLEYKKGEKYIINEKISSELYYFNKQLYFINSEDNLIAVEIPI